MAKKPAAKKPAAKKPAAKKPAAKKPAAKKPAAKRKPFEPPSPDGGSAALRKAFAASLGPVTYEDDLAKRAKALGKALDAAAIARLLPQLDVLAHELAAQPPIEQITSKPKRILVSERGRQLHALLAGVRAAGPAHDAALVAMIAALPDGRVRGGIAEVLRGDRYELAPGARSELARLLDDPGAADVFLVRAGLHSQFELDPAAAERRWRQILAAPIRGPRDRTLACEVLLELEHRDGALARVASLVFPLVRSPDGLVAGAAQRLVSLRRETFVAFLAWVLAHDDSAAMIEIVAGRIYWAMLGGQGATVDDVREPLLELTERARRRGDAAVVALMTRALGKLGLAPDARPAAAVAEPVAVVGTEGGPVLVLAAAQLAAWQGTEGPKPFDSGESDYERACDAGGPALIEVGRGVGIVLPYPHCEVFPEARGLFLLSDGARDEEVADAWTSLGSIVVGKGGIVVVDAVEVGTARGANRRTVPLPPGTYDVLAHPAQGLGGDLVAVRLVRAN